MKRYLFNLLLLTGLVIALSACRTSAPKLDYQSLAHASVRLGVEIGMKDNHELYLEASRWIGTPYRRGGETKRGTDCSGMTCRIYEKVYHIKLQRSTEGQKEESRRVSIRRLREGDLVFFSSRKSHKKTAHVGIYLKDGKFIHASSSQGVIVSNLNEPYYRTHWIAGGRVHSPL